MKKEKTNKKKKAWVEASKRSGPDKRCGWSCLLSCPDDRTICPLQMFSPPHTQLVFSCCSFSHPHFPQKKISKKSLPVVLRHNDTKTYGCECRAEWRRMEHNARKKECRNRAKRTIGKNKEIEIEDKKIIINTRWNLGIEWWRMVFRIIERHNRHAIFSFFLSFVFSSTLSLTPSTSG